MVAVTAGLSGIMVAVASRGRAIPLVFAESSIIARRLLGIIMRGRATTVKIPRAAIIAIIRVRGP
jgi:hypothetical protein